MKRTYTVELRSGPIEGLDADLLERFSEPLFEDGRLRGPAPSADLALRVLELRTTVDAASPTAGLEVGVAAFLRAAKKVRMTDLDIVDASVWIDDDSGRDRRELLSGADIAERLGISRQRVAQLVAEKGRFPRPAATFGIVSVWHWGDVVDWVRAGGRGEPHRLDAASAALEIVLSGEDLERRSALFRRLIALANAGDRTARDVLEVNPDRAFFDAPSKTWVEQVDSGRGPGVAVGRDREGRSRMVRTRR